MSSVKRRKVDESVPSGILKKKQRTTKDAAPATTSASPEPEASATEEPLPDGEPEATKSFKDLVRNLTKLSWPY